MIEDNEIILLILGLGVMIFFGVHRKRMQDIPNRKYFFSAFAVLMAGWVLTVLEGLFWTDTLNLLEHLCYALSSILLTVWCWTVLTGSEEKGL